MSARLPHLLLVACIALGIALLALPTPAGMTPLMMRAAAVVVIALGLWSTAVVPAYYGSLVFLFIAMVLAVGPASIVFSGFHAGATWLVFGGLVIGMGVHKIGLDARVVRGMLGLFPHSYLALTYGLTAGGAAMTLVVPSAAGRVALIVPIVMALAERLGYRADSKGRTGLILAATMGTMTPGFAILPANVPNMTLYGAVESIYKIQLQFFDYLVLNFPVLGIGAMIGYPAIIWLMFRETAERDTEIASPPPWTGAERKLLMIVALALALWVTDRWHGISPAWVALGAALLIVAPRIGVLPVGSLSRELDFAPVLFVAGIIGLGAVTTHTGLGEKVADALLALVPLEPGADARNYAIIVAIGVVVGLFTTLPAQPSIMAPLAQHMAEAAGWPLMSVLMAPVITWTMFPFYYQAPPTVLAVALGRLPIRRVVAMLCAYMVFATIVIAPLQFLWGRWLGYFGG